MTAPDLRAIAQALGGEVQGERALVPGPGHSPADRSLSLRIGANGRIIWHSFAGDQWADVGPYLQRAGAPLGVSDARPYEPSPEEKRRRLKALESEARWSREKQRIALGLWYAAADATGTPVAAYLQHRRIVRTPPPALRFDAGLNWMPLGRSSGPASPAGPAMLAKIEDRDGGFIGIQATWLAAGGLGKCSEGPDRKFIGALKGGRVMLDTFEPEMIVGEGVETVLSASDALALPAVAALTANNLAVFDPPAGVVRLVVAYDNDRAGRDAANQLAARMNRTGVKCRMAKPPGGAKDWNDAARSERGAN